MQDDDDDLDDGQRDGDDSKNARFSRAGVRLSSLQMGKDINMDR